MRRLSPLLPFLLLLCGSAAAQQNLPGFGQPFPNQQQQQQPPPGFPAAPNAPVAQSTGTPAYLSGLGNPLPLARGGPWVIGEVLFFNAASGQLSTDFTLRDHVRATRGTLYTRADIEGDVGSLMSTGKFTKIDPALFEIPNAPVPPEYATIAVSTSQARLVFSLTEKAVAVSTSIRPLPPAPISGVILTPTAYRGTGKARGPGLGLDFNAVYVIGRLYGKNSFVNSPHHVNYIDRVGVWLLQVDGKMQIQSEGDIRPAMGVGGHTTLMFRDSPQPTINTTSGPSVTAQVSQKSTRVLTDAYFVTSKKFGPARTSAGIMGGNLGDAVAQFSESLSPTALQVYDQRPGATVTSRWMPFANLLFMPKPQYPLGIEFIKFEGAQLHPILIDLKAGYFLHLNFDLGYLKFDNGWDLLGLLQFRFNEFPR